MANLVVIRLFAVICCVAVTITTVNAYTYERLAPEYKGQCKDQNGDLRQDGESWQYEKRCEMATCSRSNGKLYEEVIGCIAVSARKGCKLVPRLGANYPFCCPALRCSS